MPERFRPPIDRDAPRDDLSPIGWDNAMAENEDHPAKRAVIKEWDDWASKHSEDVVGNGMLFFSYLQRERPDLLLDFKYPGDKWQIVYSWLLREGRVGR
ncbi:MAG: hypothetical protein WBF03_04795 [Xanthobacteraceae bacterium]|jgi:hypothetical protein